MRWHSKNIRPVFNHLARTTNKFNVLSYVPRGGIRL